MNRNTLFTRGFTLIELLVVIAIIGILAAVVIGSLNDARSGGQDASIKQSVANIRAQAELVYNSGGAYTYSSVCSDTRVTNLLTAALRVVNGTGGVSSTTVALNDATIPANRRASCRSNDVAYLAEAPLAGGVNYWCVDSTGVSVQKATSTSPVSDYTCN